MKEKSLVRIQVVNMVIEENYWSCPPVVQEARPNSEQDLDEDFNTVITHGKLTRKKSSVTE